MAFGSTSGLLPSPCLRGSGVALEPVNSLSGLQCGFDTPGRITVQLRALLRGVAAG